MQQPNQLVRQALHFSHITFSHITRNINFSFILLLCLIAFSKVASANTPQTTDSPNAKSNKSMTNQTQTKTHAQTQTQAQKIQNKDAQHQNNNSSDLIPRNTFFSNPDHVYVKVSPDGKYLSYLAPHEGVLNVWIAEANNIKNAKPLTDNKKRPISGYHWAYNNRNIVYIDDNEGDEDWRIYSVDVKTGEKKVLAGFKKVQALVLQASEKYPDEMLIALNQRRPDFHDIYRLNILTGKMDLVYENNQFADFVADENLHLRIGLETTSNGGANFYSLNKKEDNSYDKKLGFSINQEDLITTSPVLINKKGDTFYLLDSRNRNTAALVSMDLKNLSEAKPKLIAQDNLADIDNVLVHPKNLNIQAYSTTYERTQWKSLDKTIDEDLKILNKLTDGEMKITSRSLDDKTWIVAYVQDKGPTQYYVYNRPSKKANYLFSSRQSLLDLPLTAMDPVIIKSRDNLKLISYLSLPKEVRIGPLKASKPVPMVLDVHGGPNARDDWGYNPVHQWLANRGYAVLSVNYRGSTGFGKEFVNAGNKEWGGKMHLDLIDAVQWAINQGITEKDKVCIMGGSYGGYAALVGLTKTPEFFACGVDIVGPSNLLTLMNSIPPYWKPFLASMIVKIGGDPNTAEGQQFLASRSPLTFVDNIKKPLLIGQGANDPRVKQAESDQIVKAMQAKNIPVTYVLYPDEGHGFARPENRMSFYAITESFLAKHLGGKMEPISENEFKGSSIQIKEGSKHLVGLPKMDVANTESSNEPEITEKKS